MLEEENSRKRSRKQQEEEPFSWKKEIISWIQIIVAAVIIALVLNNFIIANSRVPTGSMEHHHVQEPCHRIQAVLSDQRP